ncbi:hypothetical protein [Kribbella deserti]|uniref:Peptidase C39-like domain-containing protein n=1 Tax=Kribbella deserti TaxID=1926257 RepID=A0ABV6QKZ5_9ACTN
MNRTVFRSAVTTLVISGFAAATLAPTVAHADLPIGPACAEVRDTIGSHFEVRLCGVTDVDQFRTNLAKNGSTHCGPASLYNVLYYLGERKGLPARILPNGQNLTEYNPKTPAHYPMVTAWIGWLGSKAGMGANPTGSSAGENRAAFDAATETAKANGWFVDRGQINSHDNPEFGLEIAKKTAHAPVQIWYGRYNANGDRTYTRDGGHITTVVSAKGDLGTGVVELTLADPGRAADHKTDGYLDTQSDYRYETVKLTRQLVNVKVVPEEGEPYVVQRTYWKLTGDNYVGTTTQFVEGFNWFAAAPPVG